MVPTGHLSQVDQGAEAAGVQGAAGRALRPTVPQVEDIFVKFQVDRKHFC